MITYNYLQQNLTHLYVWFCQNHRINYFISFHGQRSVFARFILLTPRVIETWILALQLFQHDWWFGKWSSALLNCNYLKQNLPIYMSDLSRTTELIISLAFMGKEVFCSLYPFTAKSRQDMNSWALLLFQHDWWFGKIIWIICNYLKKNLTFLYVWFHQTHWLNYSINFQRRRFFLFPLSF